MLQCPLSRLFQADTEIELELPRLPCSFKEFKNETNPPTSGWISRTVTGKHKPTPTCTVRPESTTDNLPPLHDAGTLPGALIHASPECATCATNRELAAEGDA